MFKTTRDKYLYYAEIKYLRDRKGVRDSVTLYLNECYFYSVKFLWTEEGIIESSRRNSMIIRRKTLNLKIAVNFIVVKKNHRDCKMYN